MLTVFVRGIKVYAYHGVHDCEQKVGRQFSADIELTVPTAQGDDSMENKVDYGLVTDIVTQTLTSSHFRTLEAAAQSIKDKLVAAGIEAPSGMIRLCKLHPPTGVVSESAGIELRW